MKRPQSHLLDMLVTIPGLLEEERQLNDGDVYSIDDYISPGFISSRLIHKRRMLCRRITDQLEELYRWRWDWQRKNGRRVTASSQSTWKPDDPAWSVLGASTTSKRSSRLFFACPTYANDIMLYNAVLMWLFALLWKIEPASAASIIEGCASRAAAAAAAANHAVGDDDPTISKTSYLHKAGDSDARPCPTSFEPLDRPGDTVSIRGPAVEVCRAYDWQRTQHHGRKTPPASASSSSSSSSSSSGDQICLYLFPVGMARGALDDDSRAREWIRDMLDSSPVTRDYFWAGNNVAGFRAYVTPEALCRPPDWVDEGGAAADGEDTDEEEEDGDEEEEEEDDADNDDNGDGGDDGGCDYGCCDGSSKGWCCAQQRMTPCHILSGSA